MADGSKKLLYNESIDSSFSGIYYEVGVDQVGYAIVEEYDYVNRLRKIWYKPGDGLTYYFVEEKMILNDPKENYLNERYNTKTMYLTSVNNQYGDTLFFDYNPRLIERPDLVYGRKLFSSIHFSRFSSFYASAVDFSGVVVLKELPLLVLEYITIGVPNDFPRTNLRALNLYNNWNKTKFYYTISEELGTGSNWYNTARPNGLTNSKSKMIYTMTDELGRKQKIHYKKESRNYRKYTQSDPMFSYTIPAYLIDSIHYSNNKVTYLSFINPGNAVYSYSMGEGYLADDYQFLSETKRDPRTNFMLQRREIYKKDGTENLLIEQENYSFGCDDNHFLYSPKYPYLLLWTCIEKKKPNSENDLSSPDTIKVKKYFSKIHIGERANAMHDFTSVIKLTKEVASAVEGGELISFEKLYTYDLGTEVTYQTDWPYFTGTMWLSSTTSISKKQGVSNTATTNYHYEFGQVNLPYHCQPRYYMTSKLEVDPAGLSNKIYYKNFIPTYRLDKSKYFFIGKIKQNRIYNGANILSSSENDYWISGENIGRLNWTIKNDHLPNERKEQTTYSYFNSGISRYTGCINTVHLPNIYKGFLKSVTLDGGIRIEYEYDIPMNVDSTIYDQGGYMHIYENGEIVDSIYFPPRYKYRYSWPIQAKLLRTDNTVLDSAFEAYIQPFQKAPVKRSYIYNNDQDTIVNYSVIDDKNNLRFELNSNGFASEFEYDVLGRLIHVKLPGCYEPEGVNRYTQTIVKYDNNYTLTRNLAITSTGIVTGSCNTNARIFSYGNTGTIETEKPIGEDSENDEGEQGDNPVGGGGGGGPQLPNPDQYYYIFLPEMIPTHNIQNIINAKLFLQTRHSNISEGQLPNFEVYAVTQAYNEGYTNYQTEGPITIEFLENSLLEINVASLLLTLKNENKSLYGFKFVADGVWQTNEDRKLFYFSETTFPTLSLNVDILVNLPGNLSYNYVYDDINNKVLINKSVDLNTLSTVICNIVDHYDVRGNLIKSEVKNDAGVFETKSTMTYNYLGLNSKVTDAENRNLYNKYDYFSRAKETRMITDDAGAPKIKYEYSPINHSTEFERQTIIDESNNKSEKILDKTGKVLREIRYDNETPFITTYTYNSLQQLASVTTPNNKNVNYYYDDLGNISKKVDPNSGTVQFKYDRFNQLRFEVQNSQLLSTDSMIFNKYDVFRRLQIRGIVEDTEIFTQLNPDLSYGFENDTSKYLTVNMYDNYENTGVFIHITNPPPSLNYLRNHGNHKGRLVATAFRNRLGDQWSFKVYSYDALGRIDDLWIKFENQNWKWIRNEYDHAGNLIKQCIEGDMYYWYDYDSQGRLKEVRTSIHNNKSTAKLEAVYTYNKDNKISRLIFSDLQTTQDKLNYIYDNRGRLINISNLYNYTDGEILIRDYPRFIEGLTYYPNGNIEYQYLKNTGIPNSQDLMFNYIYDGLNRLITTKNFGSNYEWYTYDPDGNFITKTRSGKHMIYTPFPGTDRLQKVDIGGVDKNYQYDSRGNVISDGLRQISSISYDRRNLPLSMTTTNGANFKYKYDDNGNRLLKQANGVKEFYLRDHTGKELAVYDLNTLRIKMANLYGNGLLGKANVTWDSVLTPDNEGGYYYAISRTDERHYYIKDHLGNIRIVLDKDGEVVSAQDYYPFGEIISSRSYVTGASTNDKYKFTEKERDTETNYDYFGARYYDSELGRWLQVDPLADKYLGWSPYNYTMNDPLGYIDPNGKEIWIVGERDEEGDAKSKYQYMNGELYDEKGKIYKGNNKYLNFVKNVLNNLLSMKSKKITDVIKKLEKSDLKHEISDTPSGHTSTQSEWGEKSNEGIPKGSYIWFDISGLVDQGDIGSSFEVSLGHELYHSYDFDQGNMKGYLNYTTKPHAKRPHETRAVIFENIIRNLQPGLKQRTEEGGIKYDFNNTRIRK